MSSLADLTIEKVYEAVHQMDREHPRRYLVLCTMADVETLQNGIERLGLDAGRPTIEVRAHSFVKEGHCLIMRHPDDFEWRARFDVPWGDASGQGVTVA